MHTNFVLRQKNSMPTRYADGGRQGASGGVVPPIFSNLQERSSIVCQAARGLARVFCDIFSFLVTI